ncbi:mRNA export protein mlo3 [Penicillium waksmanii]|uniref:mRNA export protein mlo3 n=1 Tax=Penicillium waksmanii TaxID=69791 RepID=UPI0025498971|nr:mRNA export protein mlo3 [Penicillium waksmanii]KAJ5980669.1 mRNA export protein mlo3 [Penicillium waksmanii]
MSANLDKSLDDLVGNRRQNARRRGGNRRATAKAPTVGGVKKSSRVPKAPAKAVHPTPVPAASSKIIVSGLPSDVSEANIKEYFTKSAGPVKKVMLTYNQNGSSRGIASIIFGRADTAAKAAKELNGLHVDGRPMKIEVVYDASHAPTVPAPKPLNERIAHQKSQPKPATAAKAGRGANKKNNANTNTNTNTNEGAKGQARGAKGRKGRNPGRGKPKSVEELDAEMVDYFAGGNENVPAQGAAPVNAAPQANGGEDLGMAEIS